MSDDRWFEDPEALWVNGRNIEPIVDQMLGALRAAFEMKVDGPKVLNANAVEHWCGRLRDILSEARTRRDS